MDSPSTSATSIEAITEDLPCAQCGYNVRGLSFDGFCPECGSSIREGVKENVLRFSDPPWLEKLRRGASLKLWCMVFLVMAVALFVTVGLLRRFNVPLSCAIVVLAAVCTVLGVMAAISLTAPEPRDHPRNDRPRLRKVIRIAAAIVAIGAFFKFVDPRGEGIGGGEVGPLIALAIAAQFLGELMYLRWLALRIPNKALARSTRIVMWGFVLCVGMLVALGLLGLSASKSPPAVYPAPTGRPLPPPPTTPVTAPVVAAVRAIVILLVCAPAAAFFVFAIWYMRLLVAYRRAFADAKWRAIELAETAPMEELPPPDEVAEAGEMDDMPADGGT